MIRNELPTTGSANQTADLTYTFHYYSAGVGICTNHTHVSYSERVLIDFDNEELIDLKEGHFTSVPGSNAKSLQTVWYYENPYKNMIIAAELFKHQRYLTQFT